MTQNRSSAVMQQRVEPYDVLRDYPTSAIVTHPYPSGLMRLRQGAQGRMPSELDILLV